MLVLAKILHLAFRVQREIYSLMISEVFWPKGLEAVDG